MFKDVREVSHMYKSLAYAEVLHFRVSSHLYPGRKSSRQGEASGSLQEGRRARGPGGHSEQRRVIKQ